MISNTTGGSAVSTGLVYRCKTVTPPIVPVINDPSDLSNFDKFDPVDDTPAEDNSGWDSDF